MITRMRRIARVICTLALLSVVGVATTVLAARWEALSRTLRPNPHGHLRHWLHGMLPQTQNGWRIGVAETRNWGIYQVISVRATQDPALDAQATAGPPVQIPGWSRAARRPIGDDRDDVFLEEHAFGWPARAMVAEKGNRAIEAGRGYEYELVLNGVVVSRPSSLTEFARVLVAPPFTATGYSDRRLMSQAEILRGESQLDIMLPLRVIPSGFALNSTLFAAAWWIAFLATRWAWRNESEGIQRRLARRRARRGGCRACGHPLAGLARCPECGAVDE
jgi:hypothetical protein